MKKKFRYCWTEEVGCFIEKEIDTSNLTNSDIHEIMLIAAEDKRFKVVQECLDVIGGNVVDVNKEKSLDCNEVPYDFVWKSIGVL